MGHLNHLNYERMAQRLGQYVPGAFVSETLVEILKQLVTEEEAHLCSIMPLRMVPVDKIAAIWEMEVAKAREILDNLASKGMVFSFIEEGAQRYGLAPPVLGFVEFSLMRTDGKLDAKRLSELYYQYCQVEGDFIKQQGSAHPALSRVYPAEDMLHDVTSEVLSQDRVSEGIESASCITTGLCYCRHKMEHMNQVCDAPMDVCLTFNDVARHLADHGIAREISKEEAHRIVKECVEHGLVQIGDNTRDGLAIICNCCGCCCDLLLGYRRFGSTGIISPSAFVAAVDPAGCTGCGVCVERCPADAIAMEEDVAVVDSAVCLGCGVCARFCPDDCCTMATRSERPYVPYDFIEKTLLASIDAGKLGNYLFDNQTSKVHAVLRKTTNVLVTIPPIKRLLLSTPVQSVILRSIRSDNRC